jgi:hypothetical protein
MIGVLKVGGLISLGGIGCLIADSREKMHAAGVVGYYLAQLTYRNAAVLICPGGLLPKKYFTNQYVAKR